MSERNDTENEISRARLKSMARVVEIVTDELDKADIPDVRAATMLGISRTRFMQKIARVSVHRDDESPSRTGLFLAEIAMLPVAVMVRIVNRALLEPNGYTATKLPQATRSGSNLELVTSMHRESSEATSAALAALTSGHMDRAKALNAIKESRESIAVSLEFIALAESALREGVVAFGTEGAA